MFSVLAKKVSGFWSLRALPQSRASAFLNFLLFFAMKRCPIAAKIRPKSLRFLVIGFWSPPRVDFEADL